MNVTHKLKLQTLACSVIAGTLAASGCAGTSLFSRNSSAREPLVQTTQGTSEGGLQLVGFNTESTQRGGSDADLAAAQREYDLAKQLFDQQDYAAAEKAFKKIVSERRKQYETFQTRIERFWGIGKDALAYDHFGDPVEEDSLFMLAETQFARRRFTKAQDSYDDLLNRYPSTRHMDRVTRQLFRMARYWLDFPSELDEKQPSDIKLAAQEDVEEVTAPETDKSWSVPLLPNFTDSSRPVYDADGRGLQALRSIWLHDATGPLADDALMLSANHNLRIRNFVEAKRLYVLLREQYPDSPHIKDAYLLGSYVTLAAYEGPAYDGGALSEARDLKQTMVQIFPDLTAEQRQRLEEEINQMHDAEIERIWELIEFYQRKGTAPAIALHCNLLINRYPNSSYATQAREILRELQAADEGGTSWPWAGRDQPTGSPSYVDPTSPKTATEDDFAAPADPSPEPKPSLFNFLKKSDSPPSLEPPPAGRVTL